MSKTTFEDDSVTSYPPVDGNLSEKGNFENIDETTVSDDDFNPSYLFTKDTQNSEEENDQGVAILIEDNGGKNATRNDPTFSEEVTTTETDGCNPDIMDNPAVVTDELPSE